MVEKDVGVGAKLICKKVHSLSNHMQVPVPIEEIWWEPPPSEDEGHTPDIYCLKISSPTPGGTKTVSTEFTRESLEDYPAGVGTETTDKKLREALEMLFMP